jgi:hypothetical protein
MGSPDRINQEGINGQKVIFGILFVRMHDHDFWERTGSSAPDSLPTTADRTDV